MKQPFNPQDWLQKPAGSDQYSAGSGESLTPSSHRSLASSSSEVDIIILRIEAAFTDITTSYTDWLNVGFAFASEFGESGRTFFHRVSRFYNGYTKDETDRQYDQCLHSQGHGITIRTFFHMAKEAGIDCTTGRGDDGTRARWSEGEMERGCDQYNDNGSNPSSGVPSYPRTLVPSEEKSGQSFNPSSVTPSLPSSVAPSSSNVPSYPRPLIPSEAGEPLQAEEPMPTLPDELFGSLPDFLQRVVQRSTSKEERDLLLLGSITTLSACLYKIFGLYDDKKVFPNLYLYVTAKASAGKGRLVLCKKLVLPIHWSLREKAKAAQQQYEMEMREFNLIKNKDLSAEKPQKPPEKLLFIPANSSSTGMFQLLWDNEGRGLIFETEGDTLAQAFKTDFGNYSDGFRKAFQHETITYYRRTDREYVEILFPCVSCLLSGTPKQVAILIPSAENGLFSRFMFYYMNLNPVWKNVFLHQGHRSLDEYFHELGKEFYALYTSLEEGEEMEFRLTDEQQEQFNSFFTQVHEKYLLLQGVDYLATIRRLGLNAFRICMILSSLRLMETGERPHTMWCRDDDFQTAQSIIRVLVRHASHVYSELPVEDKPLKPKNKAELLLEKLPRKFSHKEFVEIGKGLGINQRTAERYLASLSLKALIRKDQHGMYTNLMLPDVNNDIPLKEDTDIPTS